MPGGSQGFNQAKITGYDIIVKLSVLWNRMLPMIEDCVSCFSATHALVCEEAVSEMMEVNGYGSLLNPKKPVPKKPVPIMMEEMNMALC
jgi:hypothetical protein